jgi:phosphoribosylanthranilate isomerase
MFRIKICGITSVEDAALAVEAGADALGLNFCEMSPRYVAPGRAAQIAAAAPAEVVVVGVFVNATVDEIVEIQRQVGLDMIQLHGAEPAVVVHQLRAAPLLRVNRPATGGGFQCDDIGIIRAIRSTENNLNAACQFLAELERENPQPKDERGVSGLLLDAYDPRAFGGTGRTLDWHAVQSERARIHVPLILAGGLTAENVAAAISTARPDAVDVASGVESAPGCKDPVKTRAFVAAARRAFAELQ